MRATFAAVVGVVVLAGCGPAGSSTGSGPAGSGNGAPGTAGATTSATRPAAGAPSAGALPVGAGPQEHYTVQSQPPAGSCHYRYEKGEPLEDPACTPGAISPAVTQANIKATICRKGGYTGGIRPPESVTGKEKVANASSYRYTGSLSDAEYDHLISLQLGGDPNDARNLWVEPADPGHKVGTGVNNLKDPVETKLHTAVCNGKITLAQAQMAITTDWTSALALLHLA